MFTFCRPVSSKKRFSPFRKLDQEYSFTLFDRASSLPESEWRMIAGPGNIFLDKNYLQITETCTNSILRSRYVIVYRNKIPCGIIYFQMVDFKAGLFGDLLSSQLSNIKSKGAKFFEDYIGSNKEEVLMRLFTCGNNLVSGEYGFLFSEELTTEKRTEILLQVTDVIAKEEKLRGTISAILLKDFEKKIQPEALLEEEGYSSFFVEPNMVVDLPAGLNGIDDYLALFSKKYRNRAKTILKTGNAFEKVNLSSSEIQHHEKRIYELYTAVYERAKFKLLKLPADYFGELKRTFPDDFFVEGFFLDGKLIAFTSYFLMPTHFEAHYIGLDYGLNQQYELYQNILYYNISSAIANKKSKVNLGRTAAEIKTTVGAKPQDLICYARPQNTLSRLIMRPFISFLQPGEWTPRNPFKEGELSAT